MVEIEGIVLLAVIGLSFAALVYLGSRLSHLANPLLSILGIMLMVAGIGLIVLMALWMLMWD